MRLSPWRRNVKWFRGGLVLNAHGRLNHSNIGVRVFKKKTTVRELRPCPIETKKATMYAFPRSHAFMSSGNAGSSSTSETGLIIQFIQGKRSRKRATALHVLQAQIAWEGRCKATWKREFKLLWRDADSPNHQDDKVDMD